MQPQDNSELQDQFLTLIKEINAQKITSIVELTSDILYTIFCVFNSCSFYLPLLYKLIFHTEREMACHILCGFIQFGQSGDGMLYKPMLDYFVVEAFQNLQQINGWSIIKPCVIALRAKISNYENESLFKHIVTSSVKELINNNAEIGYHLPREKSFTWGWFSYDIARAYFAELIDRGRQNAGQYAGQNACQNAKQMRNAMMLYRKLLTTLRKNGMETVTLIEEKTMINIEESWSGIIEALLEYQWAGDFINQSIDEEGGEPLEEKEVEPLEEPIEENGVEGAEPLEMQMEEKEVVEPLEGTETNTLEIVDGVEGAEPIGVEGAEPLGGVVGGTPPNWLYSLFGWS